ncbi:MAG: CopG family transcriptional regulator [Acidimicrobiia bacterium]
MRTTITFDVDVAAAIAQLQRREGLGVSEAVNFLIRAGLLQPAPRRRFKQKTSAMNARFDVTNVAEVIDFLEGPGAR